MIQIGVIGVGHIGEIHVKQLLKIQEAIVVGVFDINPTRNQDIANIYQFPMFNNVESLILKCDALIIASDANSHFELAQMVIKMGKHVFIEKPMTNSIEEALNLVHLCKESNVFCMVGHVERFNPALLQVKSKISNPLFIEAHRLMTYSSRMARENVILDLMIHDIDIVLSLVKSEIKRISATGVKVISDTIDIANARIEFSNGCIANLTASRISQMAMRKTRVFQKDTYFNIDYLNKYSEQVSLKEGNAGVSPQDISIEMPNGKQKFMHIETYVNENSDAIHDELYAFIHCILEAKIPLVSAEAAYEAMHVAHNIIKKINSLND